MSVTQMSRPERYTMSHRDAGAKVHVHPKAAEAKGDGRQRVVGLLVLRMRCLEGEPIA